MKRNWRSARPERRPSVVERLSQRIEDFAARDGFSAERINLIRWRLFGVVPEEEPGNEPANTERIRLMPEAYFADVDALQRSGGVQLPP